MISAQTATDIALAYREIATAEKLLAELSDAMDRRKVPDLRDAFGRIQDGLQLGVPSGDMSQRMFNVPWSVVKPVIELHIAHHKARIQTLNMTAAAELAASAMSAVGQDPQGLGAQPASATGEAGDAQSPAPIPNPGAEA